MKTNCLRSSSVGSFSRLVLSILIAAASSLSAQDAAPTHATPSSPAPAACDPDKFERQLEVLTDTAGADFRQYLGDVARKIRMTRHSPTLRDQFSPSARSCATIEFAIAKDGKLARVKLVESSGNPSFDQAATDAISTSAPFDPLPEQFPTPPLALRFHFRSNAQGFQHEGLGHLSPGGGHFGSGGTLSSGDGAAGAPIEGVTYLGQPVYKIGRGVTNPKPIHNPNPSFSEYARKNKIDGVVSLKMIVTPEGDVDNVTIVHKLEPSLDQNAIDAVRQWKFQPATRDGQPVAVQIDAEISFNIK